MPHHHGDPRSDATGEQPFDMTEYPYAPYEPPQLAPEPGNVNNFIPYRGQAQHGKQLTRNSEKGYLPYASEQEAQDRYTDQTPRDLMPIKPVPVFEVDKPDLLYRRRARTNSLTVTSLVPYAVLQRDPHRKRVIVSAVSSGAAQNFYYSTEPDATAPVSVLATAGTAAATILDSKYTGPLYVFLPTGGIPITISTWSESVQSDGDPLL